jgi:D-beta-D-heptose 7-phosphate kinase/D-beta-D-heptose 1-phosphate adenosyltransferase
MIPRSRAAEITSAFSGKTILVVGDVMLDEYVKGDVSRISPEAPVPVLEVRERELRPGGAANSAANVASLGGTPVIVGVVGEDGGGASLATLLDASRVRYSFVAVSDRPTTAKTRIVARGQQVVRLDSEGKAPLSPAAEDAVIASVERELASASACIVSDYAKGVVSERVARAAIGAARKRGLPVVVDPKARSFARYAGATLVTPNIHELEAASGHAGIHGDQDVVAAAAALLPSLDGGALLVTRGPLGMSLFAPGAPHHHLPTAAKAVFDVVGAGDTVVSTLALALAAGASLLDAVDLANRAAGVAVGKPGTATVTREELLDAVAP